MGAENENTQEEGGLDLEQLEKSFSESAAKLGTLLKSGKSEPAEEESDDKKTRLEKAGRRRPPPQDKEESDEDEEEPDEEEDDEEMGKSLPDLVGEEDSEAEVAMEVEPFLKALAVGIQKYIDRGFKRLEKATTSLSVLSKAQAEVLLRGAELQKATELMVKKIGETSVPTGSTVREALRKSFGAGGGGNGAVSYDRNTVLAKSFELVRAGKINLLQARKVEHRANNGLPLPDDVAKLFVEQKAGGEA